MASKDPLLQLPDDRRRNLKQFRDIVQDILKPEHDDYFLLRWLAARDFDLRKAEKMIRESFKFRKKLGMEYPPKGNYTLPDVYQKYGVTEFLGFDKNGTPLRYFMAGYCDFKGFAYSLTVPECLQLIIHILDRDLTALKKHNQQTGLREIKNMYIFDFQGFNIRQFYDKHVAHMVIQTLHMYQNNFPENLKVAFIVNVPSYFNWIWNMVKAFLDPVTISKIKIYKPENVSWKEEVLETVDPKILPAFLGGVLCDPEGDPTCQNMVCWNKKVPTSFYLKSKTTFRADEEGVKSVTIRERSNFEERVSVEKPGSTVRWTFQTKDYNIRFGVFYEKQQSADILNEPPEELLTVDNVECHVIPESGEMLCEKAGQYILYFDNKYSWMTSKQLQYKVTVTPPEEANLESY